MGEPTNEIEMMRNRIALADEMNVVRQSMKVYADPDCPGGLIIDARHLKPDYVHLSMWSLVPVGDPSDGMWFDDNIGEEEGTLGDHIDGAAEFLAFARLNPDFYAKRLARVNP